VQGLKKCDFLPVKLGLKFIPDPGWPDPDPNDLFRIRLRIRQKVPDPTGSVSGSTTLVKSQIRIRIDVKSGPASKEYGYRNTAEKGKYTVVLLAL
jgi:hypothetical protein